MKLTTVCPSCQKPLIETGRVSLGNETLVQYSCGHAQSFIVEPKRELDFSAVNGSGKTAREYQKEGIEFITESGFNCVIGDQMRLGKTPQVLLALKNAYKERTPCLIIVRATNLWQWIEEYKVWTDTLPLGIFPIQGGQSYIPPGFSSYIISMDTFGSKGKCKCGHRFHEQQCAKCTCKIYDDAGDSISSRLLNFGFKLVIVDEAHSFKNAQSNRSQALIRFLHNVSTQEVTKTLSLHCVVCEHKWDEQITIKVNLKQTTKESLHHHNTNCPQCKARLSQATQKLDTKCRSACGIVMLTGTAIKNRADEYFVPLNLVAPERFPSLQHFRTQWLSQNAQGKWSRVSEYMYESFKEVIKPYVLRREKEDVYTDLPPLNRMFTVIEITDERLKKAYNETIDRLESNMAGGNLTMFSNIGELNILRQICGLAKVGYVSDYVDVMLEDSDKLKVAIGIHHHSVRDALAYNLKDHGVLKLSGEDNAERKFHIMKTFEHDRNRVCILNMLAGGVGMDFHYINNALILERQWSAADEEQFEFRFYNPDRSIKNTSTNIEYIIAKGTIDQWFYDMVEEKRVIFGETLGTNWDVNTDPSSFKQLLEQTVSHRL